VPTPATAPSLADELAKLGQLRDAEVLTPEQFEQAKMKLGGRQAEASHRST
jgi:hypothetical protein